MKPDALRILLLNVQSPPKQRASLIVEKILEYDVDAMILSELSAAEGSVSLVSMLRYHGFEVYWSPPQGRDYSVAIAIRNFHHRQVAWPGSSDANRFQTLRVRVGTQEVVLVGTYYPALNRANRSRRAQLAPDLERFLRAAALRPERCVVFGGDINEIPQWHQPKIFDYTLEGHPLHSMMSRIKLTDLAKLHLPHNSYSWFDRNGEGQLLDGLFISDAYKYAVGEYYMCDDFREFKLSDHSGMFICISF